MNDFLKNLRNSGKKETSSIKKNMDTNYFTPGERRIPKERRPSAFTRSNAIPEKEARKQELDDLIPVIAENTTQLVKEIGRLAEVSEIIMESQIRQQNAMADFFESLKTLMANRQTVDDMPIATTSYASGTHYTKDDIIATINRMRDQGATFSTIAEYLRDKGIPTFSGRGQWHAQTIHRLCKQI
ncbi:recombinase family protein [Desulfobacter curvatus]|uniref:recombinase family protein n=1 Tax=Desulfobacter curvatus TaxID=2290 RepID=UPI00036D6346|nr:recombinase family protein [Desulfobacter curvatus]